MDGLRFLTVTGGKAFRYIRQIQQVRSTAPDSHFGCSELQDLLPDLDDPGIGAVVQVFGHSGGEPGIGFCHCPGPGQVISSQRNLIAGPGCIPVIIGVDGRFHDLDRIRGPVQCLQETVVPAVGRLQFFGRDHIICIILPQAGMLQRAHQAGVKADPVQAGAAAGPERGGVHGLPQLAELQAVISEQFIHAKSADGPAAVVPEDQAVMPGRIVLDSCIQELGQSLRGAHIGAAVGHARQPAAASL